MGYRFRHFLVDIKHLESNLKKYLFRKVQNSNKIIVHLGNLILCKVSHQIQLALALTFQPSSISSHSCFNIFFTIPLLCCFPCLLSTLKALSALSNFFFPSKLSLTLAADQSSRESCVEDGKNSNKSREFEENCLKKTRSIEIFR